MNWNIFFVCMHVCVCVCVCVCAHSRKGLEDSRHIAALLNIIFTCKSHVLFVYWIIYFILS